jgi:hypothetical protein
MRQLGTQSLVSIVDAAEDNLKDVLGRLVSPANM